MADFYKSIEMKLEKGSNLDILNYHNWRHRIQIDEQLFSPGYLTETFWNISNMPKDLTGKHVLDIGSNDGLNSFMMERAGAASVLGIDIYEEGADPNHTMGWNPYGAKLLKEKLNSKVEFQSLSLFDVESLGRKFDVVLLADVLNWLPDIPNALRKISSVCTEQLVIRDGLMINDGGRPVLEYVHVKADSLSFLPSETFIRMILKQLGFKKVDIDEIQVDILFDEWVLLFPLVSSTGPVHFYQNPWSSESIGKHKVKGFRGVCKVDDRVMVRGLGWVNVSDITPFLVERSKIASVARRFFGDQYLSRLKQMFKKSSEKSYVITATR